MPYGTTFFVLRLRLRMRQRPRSDPKQRPSDEQWQEKQIPQPCRPQANHPPCDPAIIPLLAHHCPPSISRSVDAILIFSQAAAPSVETIKARPERTARALRFPAVSGLVG